MNLPAIRNEQQVSRDQLAAMFIPEPNSGCWLWLGQTKPNGYGTIGVKVDGRWTRAYAHRLSYELYIGQIPAGLDLDHLCRVRCCVNPQHLEPVTRKENMRRSPLGNLRGVAASCAQKMQCRHGHEFEAFNGRRRICRECSREKCRQHRRNKNEQSSRSN